jgi:DNA-binding transcriptional LysR family regulator
MSGPKIDQHSKLGWDDLRVALALGRAGSVRAASRALGVSHSTVLRRLEALETSTGAQLFDRSPAGWELTAAGQDVFESAGELETIVLGLERRVEGRDHRLAGPVRVTMPEPILPVLAPDLLRFSAAHPDIDLTTTVGSAFADLALREADIALRVSPEPTPSLIGRRVAMTSCAIYGTKRYLQGRSLRDLERLDWVGLPPESTALFAQWMNRNVPNANVVLRVDTTSAIREAVDADAGVAIIPCAAAATRGYRRVRKLPELDAPLWVLTHEDLRSKARLRTCRDFLAEAIANKRDVFLGRPFIGARARS